MVDFTKEINNQDMVEALNDLIRRNQELRHLVESGLDKAEDGNQKERLDQLRQMHSHHIEKLSESARALGGAPVDGGEEHASLLDKGKDFISGLGKDDGALSAVREREDKLREAYLKTIDQYRASGEIVEVVNQLLDGSRQTGDWMAEEAGH